MPSVPGPPTLVGGTVDNGRSSVSFSAPVDDGGSVILDYTVTATDTTTPGNGGQTATGAMSPILITGLMNGDGYTFTVTARNAIGSSAPSAASAVVVPSGSAYTPPPDPFADALTFPLTKPVNQVQLVDEISTAVGVTVDLAITGPEDPYSPISVSNDATVWITPDTVNPATVTAAIAAHVVNPNYDTPANVAAFNAVVTKVVADPSVDLTTQEVEDGVKGIILRFSDLLHVPPAP